MTRHSVLRMSGIRSLQESSRLCHMGLDRRIKKGRTRRWQRCPLQRCTRGSSSPLQGRECGQISALTGSQSLLDAMTCWSLDKAQSLLKNACTF